MFETDFQNAIEKIAAYFKNDKVKPSITTSFLGDGKVYMSIVRYRGRDMKHVSCKAIGANVVQALQKLGEEFQKGVEAGALSKDSWPEEL